MIPPLDALRITRRSDMAVIMVFSCFGFGVLPFRKKCDICHL